jgi:hypothetical protein
VLVMSFHVDPANRFGVLAMSAALALAAPAVSAQNVGVTAATVGGPLGKPPREVERVLHVGVDVKANELITTGASDRAHLVFLDGSALSVGPEARLVIDNFVYDANHKLGELSLSATRGVFRFVGGSISKTKAVTITTPSSAVTIRGGIMMLAVEPAETKATFLYGQAMTVTGHGKTQVVTRPGWGVRTIGGSAPEQAMPIGAGALAGQMAMLEAPGGRPTGPAGGPGGAPAARAPGGKPSAMPGKQGEPINAAISRSGLPDINSDRGFQEQGRVAGAAAGLDGPSKVGPPSPDSSAANRPPLPDNMGMNGPSALPARQ